MRGTNKDNALNPRVCAISHSANNKTVTGVTGKNAFGQWSDILIVLPHRACDSGYLRMGQHPSHAVADDNIRKVVWVKLVHFGQLLTQPEGGKENGIASGITEYPGLITFAYLGVLLKAVDRFDPIKRSRHESMHEDDWNSVRIIGLKEI